MKSIIWFLFGLFAFSVCYAGFKVFGPDIYFEGLTTNGDSMALVISGSKVYQQDLVGAYAYLENTPTTTTSDEARYPISGSFTNETAYGYTLSGSNMIVYQGNPRRIFYTISWAGMTDTTSTVMHIGIKHNGNILSGSVVEGKLANVTDHISLFSQSQALMNSGDTIQLVIKSDKNAILTPSMVTAVALPFY